MAITTSLRARAQASVSSAEADVIDLLTQLKRATLLLQGSDSADALLGSVRDTSLLSPVAVALREEMGVDRAWLRADVDRLTAQLHSARTRLTVARASQRALHALIGSSDRIA